MAGCMTLSQLCLLPLWRSFALWPHQHSETAHGSGNASMKLNSEVGLLGTLQRHVLCHEHSQRERAGHLNSRCTFWEM